MIKCEKAKTILKRCNTRQQQTFCDMENVYVFNTASSALCTRFVSFPALAHSVMWGMFLSSTLQASVFMETNYSDNWHSIKNSEDLTMKQMFDISEKLVSEQSDEIYGVKTINWENSSWKYLSLIGDEQVINLQRTKVYVFSDSVLCLGKIHENTQSNTGWEQRLEWFKSSPEYRTLDRLDGEPMEFEWNISQDSIRCSSVNMSKVYC